MTNLENLLIELLEKQIGKLWELKHFREAIELDAQLMLVTGRRTTFHVSEAPSMKEGVD